MAGRCGLVVDSGAALPADLAGSATVVPLRVEIGGELLREGLDIDTAELQIRMAAGEVARSSTPSPGDYLAALRSCPAETVVVLTMVASLSAMHQAAQVAATLLAEEGDARRIAVVDTRAAAMGFGLVARLAATCCRRGDDLDAVVGRVQAASAEHIMLGALSTLAPLSRSGRLPGLVAGVGDLLHLRPVFELREGRGRRVALCRSEAAALRVLTREVVARAAPWEGTWLAVFHSDAPAAAAALRTAITERLTVARAETLTLPPVASAYAGPGMVGVALVPVHGTELEVRD